MSDSTKHLWEIHLGVYCDPNQARDLVDRIHLLLCPDPGHTSPCPVPWSSAHWLLGDEEAGERYAELVEQVRIERGRG
ncbi:hypothetical protein ACL02T_34300 [Pseudonocardia sp. RS010]|uniref:hypothetical protein n=1 Tax=Pseudonocardia sp. RS010 TaxID=3385979 RepID=UPI00399F1653